VAVSVAVNSCESPVVAGASGVIFCSNLMWRSPSSIQYLINKATGTLKSEKPKHKCQVLTEVFLKMW